MARTPEVDTNRGCGVGMTRLCNCRLVRNKTIHCPFGCLPNILGAVGAASVLLLAVTLINEAAALTSDVALYRDFLSSFTTLSRARRGHRRRDKICRNPDTCGNHLVSSWQISFQWSLAAWPGPVRPSCFSDECSRPWSAQWYHRRLRKSLLQPVVSLWNYLSIFVCFLSRLKTTIFET